MIPLSDAHHFAQRLAARGARTEQEGWNGQWVACADLISTTRGSDCAAQWDHGTGGVTLHTLQLIVPWIPPSATVGSHHPNEKVRYCAHEAVRTRHRPNTTRDGPVSGRVRSRWLTVTFAGGFSGLPRLVGLRGVVHHTRGNGGHRACHQQVPTGRSVGQCRRSHATANDP